MPEIFLKKLDLFSGASPKSLAALSSSLQTHEVKKNALVLNAQQSPHHFLYVINGWAKIFKESAAGEEIVLDVLSAHDHAGEAFIFEAPEQASYTVIAVSNLKFFLLPVSILKEHLMLDHALSLSFLTNTLKKQQTLGMALEQLSFQSASQRLACFLLKLIPAEVTACVVVELPYDKNLLAARLGMRPETLSRAMAKLSQECHISGDGERLLIEDQQKLKHYVCQHCSGAVPCSAKS